MKVLYAVQGTGNGYLTRARDLIPALSQIYDLDVLVSGNETPIDFDFPIKYRRKGLDFNFNQTGGMAALKTILSFKMFRFWREYRSLPVEQYDFVINDFEPISAWACRAKKIPVIACSHEYSFTRPDVPLPSKKDRMGAFVLRNYAPIQLGIGIHFKPYAPFITAPVIRQEIRQLTTRNDNHFTVYLPSFSLQQIEAMLSQLPQYNWHVFSKDTLTSQVKNNIEIYPWHTSRFAESMAYGNGVLCGAGFETSTEALFLGKKLIVAPVKQQFEQQCNAVALKDLGIPVLNNFGPGSIGVLKAWAEAPQNITLDFDLNPTQIIQQIKKVPFL